MLVYRITHKNYSDRLVASGLKGRWNGAGKKVIYLGGNIPFDSLKHAVKETGVTNILFFFVRKNDKEEDERIITLMKKNFIHQNVYAACEANRLGQIKRSKNFMPLHSVSELEKAIEPSV